MRDPMDHVLAGNLLLDIHGLFGRLGIPFFLVCGTALGAYRNGSFIKGDGDIDLGTLIEDFIPKADEIVEGLRRMGCLVAPIVTEKGDIWGCKAHRGEVFVDLGGWGLHRNNRYICSATKDYALVQPARLFENMDTVSFLDRDFFIPSPPEEYLEGNYGKDWKIPLPPEKCGSSPSLCRVKGYKTILAREGAEDNA